MTDMFDMFDPEDIEYGFHVVDPDLDDFWYDDDPFDDAEVWLAQQDTPDPNTWPF